MKLRMRRNILFGFMLLLLLGVKASAMAQTSMSNIVVFVRFAGEESAFSSHGLSYYENMFNSGTTGANSVYAYFKHSSYGQLDWTTTFAGQDGSDKIIYYTTQNERNYYRVKGEINTIGYSDDSEKSARERMLIEEVAAYAAAQLPAGTVIDANDDGFVDNFVIVLNGGSDISSKNLLWPHRSDIALASVMGINFLGKKINGYIMVFDDANGYGSGVQPISLSTGLLCHEMSHSLGTWDLYHAGDKLNPVGVWDLMSDNQTTPQQMMVYTKMRYCKWINESDIQTITEAGTYTLNPVGGSSTQNLAYKIQPIGSDEYFMVEYRKKEGYDASIPESGLLVYRINPKFTKGNVNYNGTTILDEQYIFRPGGTTTADGNITQAAFSGNNGRRTFGGTADVRPFYSDGTEARFTLSNITVAGETLSFTYTPGEKRILLSKSSVELGGTAESNAAISIASDDAWQVTGMPEWLTVSVSTGGSGNSSLTVRAIQSNETVKTRTATLTFASTTDPTLTATLTISQLSNVVSAPEQLVATQTAEGIKLEWIAKTGGLLMSETFEDASNPNGWTLLNTDTRGWRWEPNSRLYPARDGSNYSATLYSAWEETDKNENQRLISPTFANGKTLSFYSRSNAALRNLAAVGQYYWVEVSNDGGNNWVKVFDVSTDYPVGATGVPAYRDYVKITVDLSSHLSNQMQVRFRAFDTQDGVQYGWAIDDVEIYAAQSTANVTGYNVYRNETLIASNVSTPSYTDTTPLSGENVYTVTAVSDQGESSPSNAVSVNNNTTGIDSAIDDKLNIVAIYTLDGVRIDHTLPLSKGIYLVKSVTDQGKTIVRKVIIP